VAANTAPRVAKEVLRALCKSAVEKEPLLQQRDKGLLGMFQDLANVNKVTVMWNNTALTTCASHCQRQTTRMSKFSAALLRPIRIVVPGKVCGLCACSDANAATASAASAAALQLVLPLSSLPAAAAAAAVPGTAIVAGSTLRPQGSA
jgi:hypothetical protein